MIAPATGSFINEHFVWWLIPCSSLRESLQDTIDALATRHDAVSFTPHITLRPPFCKRRPSDDLFAASAEPITLSPNQMRVKTGDRFTQCVFLRFDEDIATLNAMREQVMEATTTTTGLAGNSTSKGDRFPHLSLLYKSFDDAEDADRIRCNIAEALSLDQLLVNDNNRGPMVFDTLQLMRIDLPVETNEDVQKWECVQTVQLEKRSSSSRL